MKRRQQVIAQYAALLAFALPAWTAGAANYPDPERYRATVGPVLVPAAREFKP